VREIERFYILFLITGKQNLRRDPSSLEGIYFAINAAINTDVAILFITAYLLRR